MDLAVETRGLTRDFGSFRAVDGIDLAVPSGSFYGFLGPNGAGKSTTIKCLTGLLKPGGGSMRILGIDPLADPVAVKRRIGVVPEDLALFDRLTGEETLMFVAQIHGIDGATARARSSDLLDLMDLKRRPGANGSGDTAVLEALDHVTARDDLSERLADEFDRELYERAADAVRARVEPHTWEAFRLTGLDGLSGAEAAGRLGMEVATVFKAKSKVQKMLKDEIQKLQQVL